MNPDRIRLVVLFGGQSAEHDVSCVSARHVLAAADPDRYVLEPVGITRDGRWVAGADALAALAAGADALPSPDPTAEPIDLLPAVRAAVDAGERVVVFPLLHGPLGEDGTVQGLLELAGVPYVGAGVLGSALAMDKAKAKEVLAAHDIPQTRYVALHESEVLAGTPAALVEELGLPLFVKPANLGSSVGITRATTAAQVGPALETALSYDEWLVVEEGVVAREIECSVLGDVADVRVSLPGEIRPAADFYTYEDKYLDGAADLVVPVELDPDTAEELAHLAARAFRALRCEGMARADFFLVEGRGLLLNELNTIPGFTPISMYPRLWAASGLPYPALVDELVRLALARQDRRRRRTDR
jgi:D-alanine-D-alanine ligase